MSRRDLPQSVIKLTANTLETCFPACGNASLAASMLDRFEVRIKRAGQKQDTGLLGAGGTPIDVAIAFPSSYRAVADCTLGGDVLVPVWHYTCSKWPLAPVPVVQDQPVYARAYGYEGVLLVYPVFRIDANGNACVRWDSQLHELPAGRYAAHFYVDGILCGVFELDKRHCCPIDLGKPTSAEAECVPEMHDTPEGVTDMFEPIYSWSSNTTCQIEPGDTLLKVKDTGSLCTTTFCKAPELIIRDGVTTETVKFVGCTPEGYLMVERGGANTIQGGAVIRFEWTANNVQSACEGC